METTFISIHDLTLDARLLYVSNSIVDILGYQPAEVVGKSCWEYFHPDEIPFARAVHGRGVQLDKAAVLNYCQVKDKVGRWIGCECVFTIVHDVLIGCTSIYRRGMKSQKRAAEAPIVRQLFSSSPRDPRYHMLSYISAKFTSDPKPPTHEPRAALFLNRFTRTLTIMYATNGLANALGISAEHLNGKSFYYCIQENCLPEAVRCLESAKANDSIAYLRFWFRDPREEEQADHDETMSDAHSSDQDEDDGGVHLSKLQAEQHENAVLSESSLSNSRSGGSIDGDGYHNPRIQAKSHGDFNSRSSSGNSTDMDGNAADAIFDHPATRHSSSSSLSSRNIPHFTPPVELEAVVSCTSDGLVVVLRRARPFVPPTATPHQTPPTTYANGLFASPWAAEPILPHARSQTQFNRVDQGNLPGMLPQPLSAGRSRHDATAGPPMEDFMNSIRDVAVFAWSLTGINGSLAEYGRGRPSGESQPPNGYPVWEPDGNAGQEPEKYGDSSASSMSGYSNGLDPRDQEQHATPYEDIHNGEISSRRVTNGTTGLMHNAIHHQESPRQELSPATSNNWWPRFR